MSQSPHVNVICNHLALLLRGEEPPSPTSDEIANLLCSVRQLLNSEAFPAATARDRADLGLAVLTVLMSRIKADATAARALTMMRLQ